VTLVVPVVSIEGHWRKVGYEFQYFTAAHHRRKGVAGRLHDAIEAHPRRKGAELSTVNISAKNDPSLHFFEGAGFTPHRDINVYFLTVFPHLDLHTRRSVRTAKTADLPAIANLINATWSGHDHLAPTSPGSPLGFLDRTPGPRSNRMLVLEDRGEIVACAGLWDWSRVQQIRVVAVDQAPLANFSDSNPVKPLGNRGSARSGSGIPPNSPCFFVTPATALCPTASTRSESLPTPRTTSHDRSTRWRTSSPRSAFT
jgi:hypothetical protein